MKLTEEKLRKIIRKEVRELNEIGHSPTLKDLKQRMDSELRVRYSKIDKGQFEDILRVEIDNKALQITKALNDKFSVRSEFSNYGTKSMDEIINWLS